MGILFDGIAVGVVRCSHAGLPWRLASSFWGSPKWEQIYGLPAGAATPGNGPESPQDAPGCVRLAKRCSGASVFRFV